jgi:hypothetical protein
MKLNNRLQIFIGFWTILLLIWANALSAAPKAELIHFWNKSNPANQAKIDHSAWQAILNHYLNANHSSGINRFNYAKLKKNRGDKQKFNKYLLSLQKLDPRRYSKPEQKAYWINFYNALTVKIILDNYPIKSITKIHKSWFAFGPWDDVHAKVAGRNLTLNNIEHGILRPIWRDNRIHYAVNCASLGCPNLAAKAYTSTNTEELLEKAAKSYVNHSRGVQFKNGKLLLSSIYDWYKVDFGGNNKSLIKHLQNKYANSKLTKRLQGYKGSIDYHYDWELNKP